MARHAIPGPLGLTNPAPVEAAARLAADHVHAAPIPLGRRPAEGEYLAENAKENRRIVSLTFLKASLRELAELRYFPSGIFFIKI